MTKEKFDVEGALIHALTESNDDLFFEVKGHDSGGESQRFPIRLVEYYRTSEGWTFVFDDA